MRITATLSTAVILAVFGISAASASVVGPTVITPNGALSASSTQYYTAGQLSGMSSYPGDLPITDGASKTTYSDGTSVWWDSDPFLSFSFSVTNTNLTNPSTHFTEVFSLPVSPAVPSPTKIGGSIGITLTSNGLDNLGNPANATMSAGPGTYLYTSKMDSTTAIQLGPTGSSLTAFGAGDTETQASLGGATNPGIVGQTSAGLPGVTLSSPNGVSTSISVTLDFTLTAGDSAAFTGSFVVLPDTGNVPEPASLALLGLGAAGLLKRRR